MEAASADTGRGDGLVPKKPADRFGQMLHRLTTDALWATEYVKFVNDKSFANPDGQISFSSALAATTRLLSRFAPEPRLSPNSPPAG
jgi:hypothetical protein